MPVQNAKELFVRLLSGLRQGTERSTTIYQELRELAEDPAIREAMEARVFVSEKVLETQDRCFEFIGEEPMNINSRLQEVFFEDFRKERGEIQNPGAKHLFILAKATQLAHLRIAEYVALVAASDLAGHYGVGVLLETCLADELAFVERTRRLIRERVEARVLKRVAERAAA